MNEELKNAYKLVAEDLHSSGCDLFVGKYDTKNGNLHFLFGIQTILEYIWNKGLSEENASKYSKEFNENLLNSFKDKK